MENLDTILAAIASKKLGISYAAIAALTIALLMAGFFMHQAAKNHDVEMYKAKQDQIKLNADRDALAKKAVQYQKERDEIEKEQKVITKTIVVREKEASEEINEVSKPDASVEEVQKDAYRVLKPQMVSVWQDNGVEGPPMLAFHTSDVQKFIVTKIERDQFEKDRADFKHLLYLEQQKSKSFSYELTDTKGQLLKTQKMVKEYEHVAGDSKKQKVWRALKTTAIVAGTAFAAYEVGRAVRH